METRYQSGPSTGLLPRIDLAGVLPEHLGLHPLQGLRPALRRRPLGRQLSLGVEVEAHVRGRQGAAGSGRPRPSMPLVAGSAASMVSTSGSTQKPQWFRPA